MTPLRLVLARRAFWPMFLTQFLGAFNDNVFKQALILLLAFEGLRWSSLPPGILTNLCAGLFILPFFLFSGVAGQWADRYEKARIARVVKVAEVVLMLCALAGFLSGSLGLLLLTLFGMGLHSTVFGPVKYAWLPERLATDDLMAANALVETATSLAILLGSLTGGVLVMLFHDQPGLIGVALVMLAVLGWLCSLWLPVGQPAAPALPIDANLWRSTRASLAVLGLTPLRHRLALGISWFWLFGAVWLTQLPQYTQHYLAADAGVATLLLVTFSVGIALGSLACNRLAGQMPPGRLMLAGAGAMCLFSLLLPMTPVTGELQDVSTWLAHAQARPVLGLLTLIGAAAGLYIVPLYALIQAGAGLQERARVIAGINVLNALFMVGSALASLVWLGVLGWPLHTLLITLALATIVFSWRWRLPPGTTMPGH